LWSDDNAVADRAAQYLLHGVFVTLQVQVVVFLIALQDSHPATRWLICFLRDMVIAISLACVLSLYRLAYFVDDKSKGHLKVSFFGSFYSSYVVFELEKAGYEYAFICGYHRDYLWLLSRKPSIDEAIITRFLDRSEALDFNTDEIIFVNQSGLR
jgi:hypothetical protein